MNSHVGILAQLLVRPLLGGLPVRIRGVGVFGLVALLLGGMSCLGRVSCWGPSRPPPFRVFVVCVASGVPEVLGVLLSECASRLSVRAVRSRHHGLSCRV